MAQKNTWTVNELAEKVGISIDDFRFKAIEKGVSLSENGEGSISMDQIKIIDPSLAYKLKFDSSLSKRMVSNASSVKNTDASQQETSASMNSIVNKQANLELGKAIVDELKSLIDAHLDDEISVQKYESLSKRWGMAQNFPKGELAREIITEFWRLSDELYDSLDKSIADREFQKNLQLRLSVIEDAEQLTLIEDKGEAKNKFKEISSRWKSIALISKEKREFINQRYRDAMSKANAYLNQTTLKSSSDSKKQKKENNLKRIGFIKRFGSNQGFGFICANSFFSSSNGNSPTLEEIYFRISDTDFSPREKQWVVFSTTTFLGKIRCAPGARLLSATEEDIRLALSYGKNSTISGTDSKSGTYYREDILSSIARICRRADGGDALFKKTVVKYINKLDNEENESAIKELLEKYEILSALSSIEDLKSIIASKPYYQYKLLSLIKELHGNNVDWKKIQSMLSFNDLPSDIEQVIFEGITSRSSISGDFAEFLKSLEEKTARKLFQDSGLGNIPQPFCKALALNSPWNLNHIFYDEDELTDTLRVILFIFDQDINHLDKVVNWEAIVKWLEESGHEIVPKFLIPYLNLVELEDDPVIKLFSTKTLADTLASKNDDEKYQTIQLLPEDLAIKLVTEHYVGTKLFNDIIGEKWNTKISELSYVAFDLESDGENIKEFSFRREANTRTYTGEEQIKSLLRALAKEEIIVGHRIKDWDLRILDKKGLKTSAFIWDTLEIEILLNPCRYAYALHTTHNSKDDTELTDRLFWNQLYRLSLQPELCKQLVEFLPKSLNTILEQLQIPHFAKFFEKTSNNGEQFFQELSDPDPELITALNGLEKVSEKENSLVVAPTNLWGTIAKHAKVQFFENSDPINWKLISREKVENSPLTDRFLQATLLRFVSMSATPIVANLAQYLKLNYFSDDILKPYLDDSIINNITCTDLNHINLLKASSDFKKIVFIGKELEGRFCQFSLPDFLAPTDFLEKNCWIPMRMAGANYMIITKAERDILNLNGLPEDVSNVWVERQLNGMYKVCYNFDYETRIERLKELFPNATVEKISWKNSRESDGIQLVSSHPGGRFNATESRVSPISKYRSLYWVTQLRMLSAISEKESGTPIIYFVENSIELSSVEAHAKSLGFTIPSTGTMARRLETISHIEKGLIVTSAEHFWEIANLKDHTRYIYVWDHLSVDKCRMMWNGKMPFGDEADTQEMRHDKYAAVMDATPKACMLAAWPTMEFRYRAIAANNPLSRLYVMDPYLDDFLDLPDVWNVVAYRPSLWATQKSYNLDLTSASQFYNEEDIVQSKTSEDEKNRIDAAMETIKKIFHFNEWKDSQKDTLPAILSRKEDYLISIPTGGGKSVLFQGPALYNAAFTNRLSIVITPLKALMEDQVLKLHNPEFGFYTNVDYLSGDRSQGEIQQVYRKVKGGELALLYVTPERFRSKSFLNALQTRMEHDKGLEYFIFDEAHCISQWGQEFRPDYLNVMKWVVAIKEKFPNTCVAMYSATVTKQIQEDIKKYIPNIVRLGQTEEDYNPIRNHIGMNFIEVGHDDDSRMGSIINFIRNNQIDRDKSRMIIFCRTRNQCEQCALALESKLDQLGIRLHEEDETPIAFFHAGMDAEDRDEVYNKFKKGEVFILCATKAFGMGMDISNVHYILHYSPPSVLEDYLQEVGRAGRDEAQYRDAGFSQEKLLPATCLVSKEDFKKAKELLLKGMLSWTNLNEIRKLIIEYITKIQSVEDSMKTPIVIPSNLWKKDQLDDTYTAFRIGLFWLEKMERFKTGFLCPSHVNVSITNDAVSLGQFDKKNTFQANAYKVYQYVAKQSKEKDVNDKQLQVSINDARCNLNMTSRQVLNALVTCTKNGWLRLEQNMRCSITLSRHSESKYILDNNSISVSQSKPNNYYLQSHSYGSRNGYGTVSMSNTFALGIIFSAVKNLLSGRQLHMEYVINGKEREQILKDAIQNAVIQTKEITKKGKIETYMPWYDDSEKKQKNIGLSIAKNYRKDLCGKRAKHIFTILQLIPGVSFKSYLDTTAEEVRQSLSISNNSVEDYISTLHTDCLRLLKYIYDRNNSSDPDRNSINWADCIITLNIEERGYQYLDSLLQILKVLGYINADSMLPTGMEMYTTSDSEVEINNKLRKDSVDIKVKADFDLMNRMRKMRLAAMNAFSGKGKNDMNHFISEYFKCFSIDDFFNLVSRYYDESDPQDKKFMDSIREEAIIKEEERLGDEQKEIYLSPIDEDINVLAGPGSGKTHTLILRCARLIYRENVSPEQILVLAYNRAVVVELRNRLDNLFGKLGLGRSASKVHVHTFSALAKIILGKASEDYELSEWEEQFLERIKNRPDEISKILPNIRYILIDEFQDITQTRLDALLKFREIYQGVKFFTIGDQDQSIYGFDKRIDGIPESTSPDYYYKQLRDSIVPQEFTMRTNYRSYPQILSAASKFLKNPDDAPKPCKEMIEHEPDSQYVRVIDWSKGIPNWDSDLLNLVAQARKTLSNKDRKDRIEDIAIFFRTNNEVYRGYEKVSNLNIPDVRIRVQGASGCELFRVREIYTVIDYLRKKGDSEIIIAGGQTKKELHDFIVSLRNIHPNWDKFYLDFAYTMILDFLDYAASEEDTFTYEQMAESIKETASSDDGQIYKIYDRYETERIDSVRQLNIVLTTMHKVKGLEFDAVIVTPSFASLPLRGYNDTETNFSSELNSEEKEDLEEERRLQYVAYTRARKILWAYRFNREFSLDAMKKMDKIDAKLGISDSNEISKFVLSFPAKDKYFSCNEYIDQYVSKNDKLSLSGYANSKQGYYDKIWYSANYYIKHNGTIIGRMSSNSSIVRAASAKLNSGEWQNAKLLSGLFVNEVFVWTYEDTAKYDAENETDFCKEWSEEAKKKGFIYIVDFAGYAK